MVGPSENELAMFRRAAEVHEAIAKLAIDDRDADRFAKDLRAVIRAQIANSNCTSSNYIPIAALMRMVRRIGIENFRHIERLANPQSQAPYLLSIAVRESMRERRALRRKPIEDEIVLEDFGLEVLRLERKTGMRRWPALQKAGQMAKFTGASRRYLEGKFREFEALDKRHGFIPDYQIGALLRPCAPRFGLADLKARKGRPRKSAQKKRD